MTTATKERKTHRQSGTGFTINSAELKRALQAVAPAVPSKAVRPILSNVLIGGGTITGTDLEVRIEAAIDYQGDDVLLPHGRLLAILNATTAEDVEFSVDGTLCVVKAGHSTWKLPTEDAKEYPPGGISGAKSVTRLPADQFLRAVRGTVFAADTESSRYALGAVLVDVKGENVTFVATDGRRLCSYACEHDLAVDDSQTLVPARVMDICGRVASAEGDEASVQLESTGKHLVATIGGTTITASLLDGRFPRWQDVVPERDAKATTVQIAELLSATRAAAIVSTDDSRGVDFTFSKDGIWLHGQSAVAGESSVTCDVVEAGEKCTVKLDPQFVSEFLRSLPSDGDPVVEVEAVDAQSAVVCRCGDSTCVIMPMAKDA